MPQIKRTFYYEAVITLRSPDACQVYPSPTLDRRLITRIGKAFPFRAQGKIARQVATFATLAHHSEYNQGKRRRHEPTVITSHFRQTGQRACRRHDSRRAPTGRRLPYGDCMLDLDRHQGRFGEHLVQLIATTAGYTCYKPDDTGDGVDLVITHTQHDGVTARPPNVELQVKTVRAPSLINNGKEISYDLAVAHYNALRAPGPTRRYFVVAVVPSDDPFDWYDDSEDCTLFRKAAYWHDLLGAPTTSNTSSIAVRVPLANRYTPEIVKSHMTGALTGFRSRFGLKETP